MNDRGQLLSSTADKPFPVVDEAQGEAMAQAILEAKAAGDSLGGVIECRILGVPAGVGGPLFDGLESRLSAAVFGIPAVKGIAFGSGFASARLRGSESNDPLFWMITAKSLQKPIIAAVFLGVFPPECASISVWLSSPPPPSPCPSEAWT